MKVKQGAKARRVWHVIVGLVLGLPMFALGQNYAFGRNVRVNGDSPGTAFHSVYSPGQHSIAARGDTVYLVWRDDRGGESHIYFARSNDAGQSFLPNVRVDSTPSGCVGIMSGLAVDDSGRIHVSWLNYNDSSCAFVYYTKSTDGGHTFLPPVRACDSLYQNQYAFPSVAVSRSGRAVYVARSERSTNRGQFPPFRVFLSRSADGGSTFLSPNTLVCQDSSKDMLYPTVAAFGDSVVLIAWIDDDTARNVRDVQYARSQDAGVSFAPVQILNDTLGGPRFSRDPSIGADGARGVYVLFSGGPNGLGLGLAFSSDTGATFAHDRDVPNSSSGQCPSLFVARGGQLYASWYSTDVSDRGEWFTYSPDSGNTFLPAVTPSDIPVTDSTSPDLGTATANEAGRVFVAWGDNRYDPWGLNDDIMFSTGALAAIEEPRSEPTSGMRLQASSQCTGGTVPICYTLPNSGWIRLAVLDETGRQVALLQHDREVAGRHVVLWNGSARGGRPAGSGIYFVNLETASGCLSRKLVLVKG